MDPLAYDESAQLIAFGSHTKVNNHKVGRVSMAENSITHIFPAATSKSKCPYLASPFTYIIIIPIDP